MVSRGLGVMAVGVRVEISAVAIWFVAVLNLLSSVVVGLQPAVIRAKTVRMIAGDKSGIRESVVTRLYQVAGDKVTAAHVPQHGLL